MKKGWKKFIEEIKRRWGQLNMAGSISWVFRLYHGGGASHSYIRGETHNGFVEFSPGGQVAVWHRASPASMAQPVLSLSFPSSAFFLYEIRQSGRGWEIILENREQVSYKLSIQIEP